jgi:LemA protein
MTVVYILIGVFVFILIVIAGIYNSFIYKRNVVKNVFSTIDVLLKKRFDLIPNLVSTVKGYAKHEEIVFTRIAELRNLAKKEDMSDDEKIELDGKVNSEMKRLMAVVENYPELKADKNFLNLQITMTEIEDQISAARRAYNAGVTEFNNACEMFPTNIFAGIFGFKRKVLFQISSNEKENVNINFNKAE